MTEVGFSPCVRAFLSRIRVGYRSGKSRIRGKVKGNCWCRLRMVIIGYHRWWQVVFKNRMSPKEIPCTVEVACLSEDVNGISATKGVRFSIR